MARPFHHHSKSSAQLDTKSSAQNTIPPRMDSLRPKPPPPRAPTFDPPIPLSQMTMEQLMQTLPTLNAAIIAHDWVPCMQKRQKELKNWLQNSRLTQFSGDPTSELNTELKDVIDKSGEIAKTYHDLFGIAKSIQDEQYRKLSSELDESQAQRSEAMIALARHVSMHKEKCAQHEREMGELSDKTSQGMYVIRGFIRKHLAEALNKGGHDDVQEVFNALVEAEDPATYSKSHVRADLYRDLQASLRSSNYERDGLRQVCSEQMSTIKSLSQDLDQYLAKIAKVLTLLQEKEEQNQKLQGDLNQARQVEAVASKVESHRARVSPKQTTAADNSPTLVAEKDIFTRDAEITNLRRKLDKAYSRENELQGQIRQLLQTSQIEHTDSGKPPSRLKRLLGQQKSSPSIPTLNSMHNLSHSLFSKEKSPSPNSRNGLTSPRSMCDTNSAAIDPLELPPAQRRKEIANSRLDMVPPSPRLRQTSITAEEIDNAVSSRFRQQQYTLPGNIVVTAPSQSSRNPSPSPTQSSFASDDHVYNRQRFNSAPDLIDFQDPRDSGRGRDDGGRLRYGSYDARQLGDRPARVLSGITEVTEENIASLRGKPSGLDLEEAGSPDSATRQMYLDSIEAARAMGSGR